MCALTELRSSPSRALAMDQEQAQIVRQISGLSEISDRYDAILCDIWGVLHNGLASFAPACEALVSFRRRGGAVVLITNAPRPFPPVKRQVLKLGVPPEAFDGVVTSGDVTIELMKQQDGDRVLHIGPERDLSLFDAAMGATGARPRLVSLEDAQYALCTGLRNDETETPDDYGAELRAMAIRDMTMICANPDIVIHRGDTLIYCAGALACRYEDLDGSVIYAGKPHAPIYDRALALAERVRGAPIDKHRVLAIGDGMRTDIVGATRAGLDALFVTGGIHRSLHGETPASPADPIELQQLYDESEVWPVAAIPLLRP
jgi:HAD superfamily hydrolase (TIGR01459 family)